jgi:hypothetical protein
MRTLGSALLLFCGAVFLVAGSPQYQSTGFSSVRPILVAQCVSCHGAESPAGGLRLDTYEGVMKGGVSGKSVVAGKPDQSLLLRRIKGTVKPQMPPGGSLKSGDVSRIEAWIRAGAKQ